MKQILNESSQHFMEKNEMTAFNSDVKQNLVLCHNFKFTIRIDQLHNGELRYACWAKPKTIMEKPDLILLDGYVQDNVNQDRFEYYFTNGEYTYIIEKIISGEYDRTVHIFLEILDKHNENSAWKMTALSTVKI
ncbi:hypothetical protein [Flagellimonas sp.]|uniref:hypothetical protein n=1 Tax=Flagellimonas sp. TaxID=2058762 RepID=UPI003B58DF31